MNVLEGRDAYLRTIAQLASERAAAKPVVASIRATETDVWEGEIPPEWRNAGFVQELTAHAASVLESDPRNSLALAQLALAIATNIPSNAYPAPVQAQLEGNAWKEIGTAHRYVSEHEAALRAYGSARCAYASARTLAHDEAVADFGRAVVLADLNRTGEAAALLEKIEPVFEAFVDRRRLVKVKALRGYFCSHEHRWQEACGFFESALVDASVEDLETRSMLLVNIGAVYTELGRTNDAVLMLHNARQLFLDLGMTVEVNRCDWNIGRALLLSNQFEKARPMLARAREVFLKKHVPEEAGLAGLDVADALIALGAADEAHQLVALILGEFNAAKLNDRALIALAYLRDILPTTSKPTSAVRHVRQYLGRLRSEPALLFLPLPE